MRLFTVRNSVREQNFGDLDSCFCQYTTVKKIIYIIGCEEGYSLKRDACVHVRARVCVLNRTSIIFKTDFIII